MATLIEPDKKKRLFSYLVSHQGGDEKHTQWQIEKMEDLEPTIATVDEVTINNLHVLERFAEKAAEYGTKLIIMVNVGKVEEVEGDRVREDLLSRAKESNLKAVGKLLEDIEVVTLPNPQWEEAVSKRFGGEFDGDFLRQVRDAETLDRILGQE